MNKNVVLYASVHHHNTQRVAMQLAKDLQADIHFGFGDLLWQSA